MIDNKSKKYLQKSLESFFENDKCSSTTALIFQERKNPRHQDNPFKIRDFYDSSKEFKIYFNQKGLKVCDEGPDYIIE